MVAGFFSSMGQLLGFILLGFFVFSFKSLSQRLLKPFTTLVVTVLFPAYFFFSMMRGFSDADSRDWGWFGLFFLVSIVTLGIQSLAGWLVAFRLHRKSFVPRFRNESVILLGIHNAGYLPLPILQPLVDERVFVYLFAYVAAFNVLFWLWGLLMALVALLCFGEKNRVVSLVKK